MNTQPLLQRRKVYDPLLRLIHAWNALAILGLLATALLAEAFEHDGPEQGIWDAHISFGYALVIGLVARLTWGLVGPATARFSDMWHPAAWKRALSRLRLPRSTRYGHDEAASLAYLALYGVLALMAASGLALAAIEQGRGPLTAWLAEGSWLEDLFEAPHEALAWAVGGFILLHFAGLFYHARIEGIPTARSMLTGFQYRPRNGQEAAHG
ncbi:MAG: cytochrome b/b6 domain-containing protein [Pseudomonadota bacterium]